LLDTELCQLLKADEIRPELARAVGFVQSICRAIFNVSDPRMLWDVLGIVYKWTSVVPVPEFEVLIPQFTKLLESSIPAASLGSYLCLLNFAHHSPGKLDIPRLQHYAICYLFQSDNPTAQQLSLVFLETTKSIVATNIQNLSDVFLRRARNIPPSPTVKRGAALLHDIASNKALSSIIVNELNRIANS
jgi:hypothetical protein